MKTLLFTVAHGPHSLLSKLVSPTPQNTVNPLLKDIIDAPSTRPLSREEDMVLGSLLHRKSQQLGTQVAIAVYTGGRPRHVSFVTKAAASTGDMPSLRTMARHHQAAMQLEEVVFATQVSFTSGLGHKCPTHTHQNVKNT